MTKDELIEAMEELPGDFEVLLDAEGLSQIQSVLSDADAGTIILEGA
jgi:hypothetical protein